MFGNYQKVCGLHFTRCEPAFLASDWLYFLWRGINTIQYNTMQYDKFYFKRDTLITIIVFSLVALQKTRIKIKN